MSMTLRQEYQNLHASPTVTGVGAWACAEVLPLTGGAINSTLNERAFTPYPAITTELPTAQWPWRYVPLRVRLNQLAHRPYKTL